VPTLTKNTSAVQIHGITKREVHICTLEKGTTYTVKRTWADALGFKWQLINVDGYLYEIEEITL
jgi:hypothetical protein